MADDPLGRSQPLGRPQPFHGVVEPRGLEAVPRSTLYAGRFGRMFRRLPAFAPDDGLLKQLATTLITAPDREPEDSAIPAGYTYLGQFIDHDLTFDPNSKLQRDNDPDALVNFRTPRFDLDSIYGGGPQYAPYLYDTDGVHFRIGKAAADGGTDLPRTAPGEGSSVVLSDGTTAPAPRRALIVDPRNDENQILSQLTLAFLQYHNRVVDEPLAGLSGAARWAEARRIVQWHYQWVVVHDFLERIVGRAVVHDILSDESYVVRVRGGNVKVIVPRIKLQFFKWRYQPYMPVEFSAAAYRFGHAMVRPRYDLNDVAKDRPIVEPADNVGEFDDLRGFRERPLDWTIEWHRFFDCGEKGAEFQHAQQIRPRLAFGLLQLPLAAVPPGDLIRALAERDLLRGKALGLPDGQAVARAMGLPDELIIPPDALKFGGPPGDAFSQQTPLWYYILKEAAHFNEGEQLGPVGGRIVAEVLLGLLAGDPTSYLRVQPGWQPTRGQAGAPDDADPHDFSIAELLRYAKVRI